MNLLKKIVNKLFGLSSVEIENKTYKTLTEELRRKTKGFKYHLNMLKNDLNEKNRKILEQNNKIFQTEKKLEGTTKSLELSRVTIKKLGNDKKNLEWEYLSVIYKGKKRTTLIPQKIYKAVKDELYEKNALGVGFPFQGYGGDPITKNIKIGSTFLWNKDHLTVPMLIHLAKNYKCYAPEDILDEIKEKEKFEEVVIL